MLNHKSILITGGTGSFGKKFSEIILKNYPNIKKLVIFSRDEYKQFEMSNLKEFKDTLVERRNELQKLQGKVENYKPLV